MTPIPKILTGLLEIKDFKTDKLRVSILKSFNDTKNMHTIISQQCENHEQTHCYSCDNEGICLFLNGVLHFKLEDISTTIKEIEIANQHFRSQGEVWNSIIGQAMLGSAYEASGKDHLASREYQKALDTLTRDYIQIHSTEYIEKAFILKDLLHDQLEYCSPQKKKTQPFKSVKNNTLLAIPWIPKYSGLHAGTKGPTWVEPLLKGGGVFTAEIILDDKPHHIHSLKQGDNLITLTSEKKFGWAKVFGDSMNASKPIAILEGDFVLFYSSTESDHNAVVIASAPNDAGAGYQYVVKRYSQKTQSLISETEPPNRYDPISINEDVKIIGAVIAVAKSIETMEDYDNQIDQDIDDPENRDGRYNELVLLVRGDINIANRLINYEETLSPQSSRDDCIKRAITSLLRDRKAYVEKNY